MQIQNHLTLARLPDPCIDSAESSDLEAIVENGLAALSTTPKWDYRSLRLHDYPEDTRNYKESDASTFPTMDAENGAS